MILASFGPLLFLHFQQLWSYGHYQFFPIVLVAVPLLVWYLPGKSDGGNSFGNALTRPLLWISALLLLLATVAWSPNIGAAAAVAATVSLLLHLQSQGLVRNAWRFTLPLLLLIKLPLNLDLDLIFWLQGLTSRLSSQFLDVLAINHVLHGHVIRIPGKHFLVEEACSGIQSLFTLIAGVAVTLILVKRRLLHSLLLTLAAAFWACAINTFRVSSVVIAWTWFGINISTGIPHEILGIILFALAIGMLISTDSLLQLLLDRRLNTGQPRGKREIRNSSAEEPSQILPQANWLNWRSVIPFALLGVTQLGIMVLSSQGTKSIDPDDPRLATAFTAATVPENMGSWQRDSFKTESRSVTNYMGRNSASWIYRRGDSEVIVSVDYPFLGWHDLGRCYQAQGCVISGHTILSADDRSCNTVTCEVLSPGGIVGSLWFSEFRESGEPLTPLNNDAGSAQYWMSRLESSVLRQTASLRSNPSNYQVQLLVYPDQPLTQKDREELLTLHRQTAENIVAAIREATKS